MNTLTKFSKLLCAAIALFVATAIATAQSTLTFDDISTANFAGIPNGYGGVNWINFFVQNTLAVPFSNYPDGVVSSPNVAANGGDGSPASISSSSVFTLNSAYFMPLVGFGSDFLYVNGYSGGNLVYSDTYFIPGHTPTLINFDYANVDTVWFATGANVPFAMDDMTITVPEPSTCTLASLAAAFGLISRRKKSRSE